MIELRCDYCAYRLCTDIARYEPGDPCPSCSDGVFEFAEKPTVPEKQTGETMANIGCDKCSYIRFVNVERYKPGNKCPACKDGILKSVPIKKAEKETVPEIIKSNVYREYLLYVDSYIRARFYWVLSSTSRKEKLMTDLIDKADSIMSVPIQLGPESIPNRARAMCSIAIAIDDAQTGTSIVVCSSFVDFRDRMNRMFGTKDDQ